YRSFEAVEALARRFSNNWALHDQTLGPGFGLELTRGDSSDRGSRNRFGSRASASYRYSPSCSGTRSARQTAGGGGPQSGYPGGTAGEDVSINALGTASLELGQDDVVSFLTLFNRIASDQATYQSGMSRELGGTIERWQLQYVARTMWF